MDRRVQLVNHRTPDRSPNHENAAVPPILPEAHIFRRQCTVRLFDEPVDNEAATASEGHADANVSVARLRMAWHDTDGDGGTVCCIKCGARHGALEGVCVRDNVIRGHHHEHGIVIPSDCLERCDREGGRRVVGGRFKDDASWLPTRD